MEKIYEKLEKYLSPRRITLYISIIVMVLLVLLEIMIGVQYYKPNDHGHMVLLYGMIVCFAVLDAIMGLCVVQFHANKVQMLLFAICNLMLVGIAIISGNRYLSVLYCCVLTVFYTSMGGLRRNFILVSIALTLFIASFVCGYVREYNGVPTEQAVVEILSGCVTGLLVIVCHFIIESFLIGFYRVNVRLQKSLRETNASRKELKSAYEQLAEKAVFEERNRIAKDIHDNTGHSITAIIMQTEAAKLQIDSNPEEAKRSIIAANMQAKNALEQMRESVHLLAGRNSKQSLKEDIEEIIAQTIDGTDLKVRSDLDSLNVDGNSRRILLNSLKECLSNGIRHGGATAFFIECKRVNSKVYLVVSDNGEGIVGDLQEGFGLKGIRAAVEEQGGAIYVHSEEGEGFEIEIILPYKENEDD